jgi:hypothetical protein
MGSQWPPGLGLGSLFVRCERSHLARRGRALVRSLTVGINGQLDTTSCAVEHQDEYAADLNEIGPLCTKRSKRQRF